MSPTKKSQRSLLREWWSTVGLTLALLAVLTLTDVTRPFGDLIYDHWLRWHGFEPTSDIVLITVDDRTLSQLGQWPLSRKYYAQLLNRLKATRNQPKAIGFDLLMLTHSPQDAGLAEAMRDLKVALPLEFRVAGDLRAPLQMIKPSFDLQQTSQLGHINLSFDPDGVIRGFDAQVRGIPQLCLLLHTMGEPNALKAPPLDGHWRFEMVNPAVGFPKVSLVDALDAHYPTSIFKNKFVLLGVTATDLGDRYPTIYSGESHLSTPGVEILASVLKSSLEGHLIRLVDKKFIFIGNMTILILVLLSLLKLPPRWGLVLDITLILGLLFGSYTLLTVTHLWASPVPLVLVLLLLKPIWSWRRLEAILQLVNFYTRELKQPGNLKHKFKLLSYQDVVLHYGQILESAVQSARAQIDFLDQLIRQLPNGILIFDQYGRVLLKNQVAINLLESDQVVQFQSQLLEQLKVTYLQPTFLHTAKESPPSIICNLKTPLGNKALYLRIEEIKPIGSTPLVMAILTDVTELRQSQTQRDRALQFLSHDMRTPIASIMAVTQGLQEREPAKHKINQHTKTLLQMMEDFILTVKLETMAEHFKDQLLDNLLDDAIEQSADLAYQRQVRLVTESDSEGVFVNADSRLIVRMLMNLIFNAVKFSPKGSEVTVRQEVHATTSDDIQRHQVELLISNWVNTTEHETANHEIEKTLGKGFGLGLAFVDTVVKRHRGSIERFIPKQGLARVRITLPCEVFDNQ